MCHRCSMCHEKMMVDVEDRPAYCKKGVSGRVRRRGGVKVKGCVIDAACVTRR